MILMDWQLDSKLGLIDLWQLPCSKYQARLNDLVDYIHWHFCRRRPVVPAPNRTYATTHGLRRVQKRKQENDGTWNFDM